MNRTIIIISCLIITLCAISMYNSNVEAQNEDVVWTVVPKDRDMEVSVTSANASIGNSTEYLTIVGEVFSPTSQEKIHPKVVVVVYDKEGNVVCIGYTYADLHSLPAEGRSAFQITFFDDGICNSSKAKSFRILASAS